MAYGKQIRKDLDQEFINYIEEKWKKYESAKKKAEQFEGTTKRAYWVNRAYSYRVDYDIAMAEYDARIAKDKVKLHTA